MEVSPLSATTINRIPGRSGRRALPIVTAAAMCAAAGHSLAIDKHWNAASGTWGTSANWSPLGVPAAAERVFIGSTNAAENDQVSLTANATVAAVTVTDGMRIDTQGFQLAVTGDTVLSGQNLTANNIMYSSSISVDQGAAAIDCSLNNLLINEGANVRIWNGARLRVSGLCWLSGGSMYGEGILDLAGNGATSLRVDGSVQASPDGFVINQLGAGKIDLDGMTAGDRTINITTYRTDGSGFAHLTVNGTELLDTFDDDLWIGGRSSLTMNLGGGWTFGSGAELTIFANSSYPGPAEISGGELTFDGSVRFVGQGAHGRFNCPVILNPSAGAALTPSDRLEFTNDTTVHGGSYTLDQLATIDFSGPTLVRGGSFESFSHLQADGSVNFRGPTQWFGEVSMAGVARQFGAAAVIGATSIDADIFDMDGEWGTTVWNVGAACSITADRIDTTDVLNGFNGTMTVSGGFLARLTVNITFPTNPSWSNFGDLTLVGDPNFLVTRLSGSRLFQNGDLHLSGKVQATADLTFGGPGVNTFTSAATVLRTTGRTDVYPGATFVGSGTLQNSQTGNVDLANQSSLGAITLANEGLLTLGTYPEQAGRGSVGRFSATPSARMIADLGGYTPGTRHDRLDVTPGGAQLAGDLEVNLVDSGLGLFHPQVGDTFTILSAAGGITGAFAADPVTVSDGHFYHWTVVYGATAVALRLDEIVPVPCYADFNQDGGIDGADVDAFFAAWGEGDLAADVNLDGGIDGADVTAFFEMWEAGGC